MKKQKLLALILALALALTVFAGCGGQQGSPSPEQPAVNTEPIKIGHIADLTGVESLTGQQMKTGMDFAIKSLGGMIAGRPVEIIEGDSQSSQPAAAVDVARKMVEQDGVVAIIGPNQIPHKSAVADYMKEAGVPLLFYSPTPFNILQDNDWLVGVIGTNLQMPSMMGDYAYKELGYRRVHTLSRDDASGRSFIQPFVDRFTELGGTIVTQQWAPQPTLDYAPYFATMSDDVDALVAWVSGADAIAFWTAWYELGINEKIPVVAAFHGGFTDFMVAEALNASKPDVAEAMIGTFAPLPYVRNIQNPENEEFVNKWVAEFGQDPRHSSAGDCAQTVYLLAAAIESLNGDTSPDKLIKAILELDFNGPEGRQYFENGSHASTKDYYIGRVVRMADGSFNYEVIKKYDNIPPTGVAG